jgi:hypothetical protein
MEHDSRRNVTEKFISCAVQQFYGEKKMDMNETIEGIEDKGALLGEPFEAEVCYAFGWEVGVESLYDGLQGAKAMKTRGAVGEKLKNRRLRIGRLLAHSHLRTVRESFPPYRSSIS